MSTIEGVGGGGGTVRRSAHGSPDRRPLSLVHSTTRQPEMRIAISLRVFLKLSKKPRVRSPFTTGVQH
eukprot:5769723-Prymnesium_polylepis.1